MLMKALSYAYVRWELWWVSVEPLVDRGVFNEAVRNDGEAPHFVNAALPGASGSRVPDPISFVMPWHGRTGVLALTARGVRTPWFEPAILRTVAGDDNGKVGGLRGFYGCGICTTSQPCRVSHYAHGDGCNVRLKCRGVPIGECVPLSEDKCWKRRPGNWTSRMRRARVMLAVTRRRPSVGWVRGWGWGGCVVLVATASHAGGTLPRGI